MMTELLSYIPNCRDIEPKLLVIGIILLFVVAPLVIRFLSRFVKNGHFDGETQKGKIRMGFEILLLLIPALIILMVIFGGEQSICGNRTHEQLDLLTKKIEKLQETSNNIPNDVIARMEEAHKINIDINGEYFYRSSSINEKQMLLDEEGEPSYILTGYLTIENNKIIATRACSIRLSSISESLEKREIAPRKSEINWDTNHMFIASSNKLGKKDQVIYQLKTRDHTASTNEGFFIGEVTDYRNENGTLKANTIEGEMHYMMKTEVGGGEGNSWAIAKKMLKRRTLEARHNPFTTKEAIREWLQDFYPDDYEKKNFSFPPSSIGCGINSK